MRDADGLRHPHITGTSVLVTGAAGSIGSALCQRILALRPARLVCLNLTEHGLVALERTLRTVADDETALDFVLGSVTEAPLLAQWMRGVDTVIHTAAYKFVPCCESNPAVAVHNNLGGTLRVCDAAQQVGVTRCVLVSTDKAVEPSSVMGATKRLAECLVRGYSPGFLTVRFGNVLDSAGSVLPLWRQQIAAGGPLTLTDPACTRYFMSVDEACTLILETLALDTDQGTYVFDMGEPQSLFVLAEATIAASGQPCLITTTGLRPGEKLTEELATGPRLPTAHPRIFQVDDAPAMPPTAPGLHRLLAAAQGADDATARELLWDLVQHPAHAEHVPGPPPPPDGLTFVTWKWKGADPNRQFASEHVNVLRAMLARHYHAPHRLVCLTDDPSGLDPRIEALSMPQTKADHLRSPNTTLAKVFPACYRRLWLFSHEAATLLPGRICLLDIDVVILDDLTGLLQSKTADFVGWTDQHFVWNKIAGGFWLHTTGTRPDVWEDFNPTSSPQVAYAAGNRGSDQAWLSYKLYPPQQTITQRDGVVKLNWIKKGGKHPPPGTRMVFTTGTQPPWSSALQRGHAWIPQYWRGE